MNRLYFPQIAICLCTSAYCFSQSVQISPIRTISVSGSADIKINPDLIYINLGIETRRPNLDTAKSDNDQSVLKLLAFLRDYGIASKDIQTGILTINPVFSNYEENNIKYYSVVKTFSITMHSAAAIDKLISGCITNGATNIYGIDFRTSELKSTESKREISPLRQQREGRKTLICPWCTTWCRSHHFRKLFWGFFLLVSGYSFNHHQVVHKLFARMETQARHQYNGYDRRNPRLCFSKCHV
ncbi:MAG: SIMPL domain-containing protein [Holophagaceae bacterium]|nr:SIMPL domain-containing protein [Holophagaceae bacterium]